MVKHFWIVAELAVSLVVLADASHAGAFYLADDLKTLMLVRAVGRTPHRRHRGSQRERVPRAAWEALDRVTLSLRTLLHWILVA